MKTVPLLGRSDREKTAWRQEYRFLFPRGFRITRKNNAEWRHIFAVKTVWEPYIRVPGFGSVYSGTVPQGRAPGVSLPSSASASGSADSIGKSSFRGNPCSDDGTFPSGIRCVFQGKVTKSGRGFAGRCRRRFIQRFLHYRGLFRHLQKFRLAQYRNPQLLRLFELAARRLSRQQEAGLF